MGGVGGVGGGGVGGGSSCAAGGGFKLPTGLFGVSMCPRSVSY